MDIIRESLPQFIDHLRTVLDNTSANAEINAGMLAFGYDAEKMQEGQALLDALIAADETQVKEYADQYAATNALQQAQDAVDQTYGVHRAIAKRLFPANTQAYRELLLNKRKARRRADWLRQATIFYSRLLANPEWIDQMATFGQTQAVLQAAQTALDNVANLDSVQQKETAEAQQATRARDEIWNEARVWLSTFLEVANFALQDNPQLIEAFKIVEPS